MTLKEVGEVIFQAFVGNGAYDLATWSAKEIYVKLKEIITNKNIKNIPDEKLHTIANNIKECIDSNNNYKECYKKVIINSFEGNENSIIKVGGDEKYIKDSFKNNKNTIIDV